MQVHASGWSNKTQVQNFPCLASTHESVWPGLEGHTLYPEWHSSLLSRQILEGYFYVSPKGGLQGPLVYRVILRVGSLGWYKDVPRLNSPSRANWRHAEHAQTDISTLSSPFNNVISITKSIVANACTGKCIYTLPSLLYYFYPTLLSSCLLFVVLLSSSAQLFNSPHLLCYLQFCLFCLHLQRSCLTILIYFAICSFVFFTFIFSAAV